MKLRLRLDGSQDDGKGGTEYRVDLSDPALTVRGTLVYEHGEDYYCVYGPTALDALREAVRQVESGAAADHFADVRHEYAPVVTLNGPHVDPAGTPWYGAECSGCGPLLNGDWYDREPMVRVCAGHVCPVLVAV